MTIHIGLCGATGKMGQAIINRISRFNACKISEKFSSTNRIEDLHDLCKNSTVVIDFSSSKVLQELVKCAKQYNTKLVIGTTNLQSSHFDCINEVSEVLPIIYSANMSLGVNLLGLLTRIASKTLNNSYDIEILDKHHRAKKDAPSGTAILFSKIIAEAKGLNNEYVTFNRNNRERRQDEIGISSIRGGSIYGTHDIFFLNDDETITLQHQALNRNCFADGAIKAAIWLNNRPPGLYSMFDVFDMDLLTK